MRRRLRILASSIARKLWARKIRRITSSFREHTNYDEDAWVYLKKFGKKGACYTPTDYSFFRNYGWGRSSIFPSIYTDGMYSIIFTKEQEFVNEPLACISFDIMGPRTVVIRQIQGVKDKAHELRHWRWEKMLVSLVVEWAQENNFAVVKIVSAENNGWQHKMPLQMLKLRYDVTAQRLGFKLDPGTGNYYKRIPA